MNLVEQTPVEATGIRAMAFHPNGRHTFAALQDGLRVWSWEPPPCLQHDSVDVPWYKVGGEGGAVVCGLGQNQGHRAGTPELDHRESLTWHLTVLLLQYCCCTVGGPLVLGKVQ